MYTDFSQLQYTNFSHLTLATAYMYTDFSQLQYTNFTQL